MYSKVQAFVMEALRQIPPINDILRSPELERYREMVHQPFVLRLLSDLLSAAREDLVRSGAAISRLELTSRIAEELARRIEQSTRMSLHRVINASGVVLHTNLGRAPLPECAIDHLREGTTGYSNLEYDIENGNRGKRDGHIESILQRLLGCEAAVVTNNNAAAVLLILNTLAEGGDVIVSRGELVEIGGSFRIPDIMSKSGARLREAGTTNRTRIKDYEAAITENTRLLLRVHPSNFRMVGFTERPTLEEFVALGHKHKLPTCEDLGSGCLADFSDEPLVGSSLTAGVDVVCFSGDKLLGGPQAGIIAGQKLLLERIRRNPLFRALRVDKLTLSALESVLGLYLAGRLDEIPVWRMLRLRSEELKKRAEALEARSGGRATATELASLVGGGSAPEFPLPSWGVAVEIDGVSSTELEKRFRNADPPVVVRIEKGRVILDLRTVMPGEEEILFDSICKL